MGKEIIEENKGEPNTISGVKVVLNGGKSEMDSATIPIEWHFNKDVIEKKPKYVVLVEQSEAERKRDAILEGRRYIRKVTEAIVYIQLFSPGYHRLAVLVFADKLSAQKYLKVVEGKYYNSISFDDVETNLKGYFKLIAATVAEFEVPEELFAKKPQTKLGKAFWEWTNLLYGKDPINQCKHRKRVLFAFTFIPTILWVTMTIFAWLCLFIGGFCYALYVFLASIFILFLGYRPKPILSETKEAFLLRRDREWNVFDGRGGREYRGWDCSKNKYMPITGIEIVVILIPVLLIVLLSPYIKILSILFLISMLIIATIWISSKLLERILIKTIKVQYFIKLKEKREKEKEEKRKRIVEEEERLARMEEEEYLKYLWEYFQISKMPKGVDLRNLPPPRNFVDKVLRFRVSFWSLKAKICKPYPR